MTANISHLSGDVQNTVGLFIEGFSDIYQIRIWPGITRRIKEFNLNLICFAGGALGASPQNQWEYQRNRLYDIASSVNIGGLMVLGSIGNFTSGNTVESLISRYSSIPVVSMGPVIADVPSVYVDYSNAVKRVVTHMVEIHGARKIAFVRGPEGNSESKERLGIYRKKLEEYDIKIDERLIIEGDFTRDCGKKAVNKILEVDRGIDAVVAANDDTALGCIEELKSQGIRVPEDVAVIGFDNAEEGRFSSPSLTTVEQPIYKIGENAVDLVYNLMNGNCEYKDILLDAQPVFRRSCGCSRKVPEIDGEKKKVPVRSLKKKDVYEVVNYSLPGEIVEEIGKKRLYAIISIFLDALQNDKNSMFAGYMDELSQDLLSKGKETGVVQRVFTSLHKNIGDLIPESEMLKLEKIIYEARYIFSDASYRRQGYIRQRDLSSNILLRDIGEQFSSILDFESMKQVLKDNMPEIGFNDIYICFYKEDGENASVVFKMKDGVSYENVTSESFRIEKLVPDSERRMSSGGRIYVVEPLYYHKDQFGYMVIKWGPLEVFKSIVYEIIREYISNTIHTSWLLKKVEHQKMQLAKANTELEKLREKEHQYLKAIKNELNLGRKIQNGFLPEKLPEPEGWEMNVRFTPAREVSGDFYDTFMLDQYKMVLVVADVSGKDVSAALFMALIRSLIRVFSERSSEENVSPLKTVDVVNDYIIRHHKQAAGCCMFVTLVYGILDIRTGVFEFINAGHNPIIAISSEGSVSEMKPKSPAVGLSSEINFYPDSINIEKGESLFLYTDGVTETQNESGELYGRKRLMDVLRANYKEFDSIIGKVDEEIKDFTASDVQSDDITMFALRRKTS